MIRRGIVYIVGSNINLLESKVIFVGDGRYREALTVVAGRKSESDFSLNDLLSSLKKNNSQILDHLMANMNSKFKTGDGFQKNKLFFDENNALQYAKQRIKTLDINCSIQKIKSMPAIFKALANIEFIEKKSCDLPICLPSVSIEKFVTINPSKIKIFNIEFLSAKLHNFNEYNIYKKDTKIKNLLFNFNSQTQNVKNSIYNFKNAFSSNWNCSNKKS